MSSKVKMDKLLTFMPTKDTMEPIFMPGLERTEITKDGNISLLEEENSF